MKAAKAAEKSNMKWAERDKRKPPKKLHPWKEAFEIKSEVIDEI